jgi:hypothetical protein
VTGWQLNKGGAQRRGMLRWQSAQAWERGRGEGCGGAVWTGVMVVLL